MEQYTNYCTHEQNMRANKLGAPIIKILDIPTGEFIYEPATTQQILGWLRERYLDIVIEPFPTANFKLSYYASIYNTSNHLDGSLYGCICVDSDADRNKLELAAIDAALDYLEKGKTK